MLAAGVAWNVYLGIADWLAARDKPNEIRSATRLVPLDPAYPAQLANDISGDDPKGAEALRGRTLKLDPYYAVAWVRQEVGRHLKSEPSWRLRESNLATHGECSGHLFADKELCHLLGKTLFVDHATEQTLLNDRN